MAESDPCPKVRSAAWGGMGIQPPNAALADALERRIAREPGLAESAGFVKLLRHHLKSRSLEELMDRVESTAPTRVRQAAAQNLDRHAPSRAVASRLGVLAVSESNEILRRCLERGRAHHEATRAGDRGGRLV